MKNVRIEELSEAVATQAIELLRALVEAGSVNPPGDTRGPADVAADWLTVRGLVHETVATTPEKPNIIAHLDNGNGFHLVLNAHLDTVPPGDLAIWNVPPFALTESGGRLYGLGTGNMKGAAAAMLMAFHWLDAHRARWSGRVTLTLVADECVFGPDGAAHLLETRPDVRGDMLICGEGPGGMRLAVAEKGLMWVRLIAKGRTGQGMLTTRGGSATARLARVIATIDGWNDGVATPPLASLNHADNAEGLRLSVNVGRITGGGFISQAADSAEAEVDFRLPCGMRMADVSERLDAVCDGDSLEWRLIKGWEPNWVAPDAAVVDAVRVAAQTMCGAVPKDVTRLPASDASRWRALDIPAVCFGPQPELASGVDDYVNRRDYLDCISIYAAAVVHLLRPQTAV